MRTRKAGRLLSEAAGVVLSCHTVCSVRVMKSSWVLLSRETK